MPSPNTWEQPNNYQIPPNAVRPKDLSSSNAHMKSSIPRHHMPRQRVSNLANSLGHQVSSTSTPSAPPAASTPVTTSKNFQTFNGAMNINQNPHQTTRLVVPQTSADKRLVVTFKVVEQYIDSGGKILKEVIVKNDEFVQNLGKVPWSETPSSISSMSNINPSHSSSSGMLADVSSSGKESSRHSNSAESHHNTGNIEHSRLRLSDVTSNQTSFILETPPATNAKFTALKEKSPSNFNQENNQSLNNKNCSFVSSLLNPISEPKINENKTPENRIEDQRREPINEIDEEERRATATALLSLQSHLDIKVEVDSDSNSSFSNVLKSGSKIMAKWRDKNYYPAVIKRQIQNNKWSVVFEDGAERQLFEYEIINLNALPIGQSVMVSISDGFCTKGNVCSFEIQQDEIYYNVELLINDKNQVNRYSRKDLFLTNDQALALNSKIGKPQTSATVFADVDLDNIVCGKRSRNVQKTDVKEKQNKTKIRQTYHENDHDITQFYDQQSVKGDSVGSKRKRKNLNQKPRKKCTINVQNESNIVRSPLLISPRTIKSNSISMPTQELEKLLGPIPESNTSLFMGISFLLTSGDRNNDVEEGGRSIPFDKVYLTKQIQAGGGIVYESFEDSRVII